MATIKGFIFDLDGVIVDTAKFHFKAWHRLAHDLGIHFTEEENEQLKGVSRRESLQKILDWGQIKLSESEFEKRMAQKNDWYLEFVREMGQEEALPGAKEFLRESAQLNLTIGLGSASKNARLILDLLEITPLFQTIIDGTVVSQSKPDPEVFLKGAEALQMEPKSLVVFEDSLAGIEAARRGGFRTVGIGSKSILKDAEIVVSGLDQISPVEVINQLNF
ncbi:beta-phosphoglucomutase [Croceimicrobium hydrocarbonivorans]|uniref:Beta-phosphoglucomutase n=1 Tax=Croceimicrobium hydrocarbonivorans TaxID=2761580 RepID=A0A7H0VIS6_9FLAO|nr:beta-phosphoglucomutase [Croceimicrobium hydrocarbonivorans]QNR25624.1 beta-phosphoglucomutase [Croceimicrobium hydrocarbonivorans]